MTGPASSASMAGPIRDRGRGTAPIDLFPFSLLHNGVSWPPGTFAFALRSWVALVLGYWLSFFLQLDAGGNVGVGILILVAPAQGMILSKAVYRVFGTLVGASSAIVFTACFPQDRTMLIATFAVYMGALVGLGTVLRDFRTYGCILAGYTVVNISIANIDNPTAAFQSSLDRVAVTVLGVFALALASLVFAGADSTKSLVAKLRVATKDTVSMALEAMDRRRPPDPALCVAQSSKLMPLRSEISFATTELSDGVLRAKGARSALLGLFEMLHAIQGLGLGLRQAGRGSATVDRALAIAREAVLVQRPRRTLQSLDATMLGALRAGSLSLEEAYVLDRVRALIETMGDVRDGLHSMRSGSAPDRVVSVPVHQDHLAVLLNGLRVTISVAIACALSVWSGLPGTVQMVLGVVIFVSLGSVLPDPRIMGKAALVMTPVSIAVATFYVFFLFPLISGFPLFALSLAPIVLLTCWLIKRGRGPMGLYFGINCLLLVGPINVQSLDPEAFTNTATFLAAGGLLIFLSFLFVIPVDPAQRRLRIALRAGDNLRSALGRDDARQPGASIHFDRLSQLNTWQRGAPPPLARWKLMRHLSNMGNLAVAARRCRNALDRIDVPAAAAAVPIARQALSRLAPDELLHAAGSLHVVAGDADDGSSLNLIHVSAALYGVAVLADDEARLLGRLEGLGRAV